MHADHVGVYVMVSYLLVMKGSVWHIFLSVCPLFSLRSHCISQILESVNHIHQHDIVHRDLKVSGCPLPWQPCTYTHTYTHTHLCSWPWQHTDGSRSLLFLCIFCFYPYLFFFPCVALSHPLLLPLVIHCICSQICQLVCLWPELCVCVSNRMHVCSCQAERWWVMITWQGWSLTYGKEKTRTQTAHMHVNTHAHT